MCAGVFAGGHSGAPGAKEGENREVAKARREAAKEEETRGQFCWLDSLLRVLLRDFAPSRLNLSGLSKRAQPHALALQNERHCGGEQILPDGAPSPPLSPSPYQGEGEGRTSFDGRYVSGRSGSRR